MNYSIVVPVYNGELTVQKLYDKINAYFDSTNYTYEIIFVHDCGKDNSLQVLDQIKTISENVQVIELSRNYGQHNAIICGFQYCSGDFVVTMDEDLQQDPYDIQLLIDKQNAEDSDVVYGVYKNLEHSAFRNITSQFVKSILSKALPELHRDYSAFRLLRIDIAYETTKMRNSYTFLDGYITWVTQNISSVVVSHRERIAGESSYNIKKLTIHLLNIIFTFSKLPVKLLTYSSICMILLSTLYSIYLIYRKMVFDDIIPGFSSTIIFLGIGISMILFGLSIIGEYLFRVNLKTTKRPNFIVKKTKK